VVEHRQGLLGAARLVRGEQAVRRGELGEEVRQVELGDLRDVQSVLPERLVQERLEELLQRGDGDEIHRCRAPQE
jgi:hypothetical protein